MKPITISKVKELRGDKPVMLKSRRSILPTKADALKDYKVLNKIGKGAFGVVYSAVHATSGEKVAIKFIDNFYGHSVFARRTLREISILRQLKQMTKGAKRSHVIGIREVLIYTAKEGSSTPFVAIIMDQGPQDLQSFLSSQEIAKSRKQTMSKQYLKMLYSLLCSLHFLETAGVVHRDIKPANLLIGKDSQITLCDFGFARTVPEPEQLQADTLPSTRACSPCSAKSKGYEPEESPFIAISDEKPRTSKKARNLSPHVVTRAYRPPEVILMAKEYDSKVDVWSAGTTLIEIFNALFTSLNQASHNPFLGTYCYPLSPLDRERTRFDRDQLQAILQVLGQVDTSDTAFLSEKAQLAHVKQLNSKLGKIDFSLEYNMADSGIMEIFNKMMEFNPQKRSSAGDLLKASCFDEIRDPELEKAAPSRVCLSIDAEGEFDYEKQRSVNSTKRDFLDMLFKEAELLNI